MFVICGNVAHMQDIPNPGALDPPLDPPARIGATAECTMPVTIDKGAAGTTMVHHGVPWHQQLVAKMVKMGLWRAPVNRFNWTILLAILL